MLSYPRWVSSLFPLVILVSFDLNAGFVAMAGCVNSTCDDEPLAALQLQLAPSIEVLNARDFEVWGADQSNSVSGMTSRGVKGSYLWIWKSLDIERQIHGGPEAQPLGCSAGRTGPCSLLDVFPAHLEEVDVKGQKTGNRLGDLVGFGRLHGTLPDPLGQYVVAPIFAPEGGFIGIIETKSKAAVALFRATLASLDNEDRLARSIHMCFWSLDGSAVILANLNGKILERLDITRNSRGQIMHAVFNREASLGLGKGMSVHESATSFHGLNAHGTPLIGGVVGFYSHLAFSDLTPSNVCKEDGCDGPPASGGGRPNNVVICPIPAASNHVYVTLGGGGLFIVDLEQTPMEILAEYGNNVINGAGCAGVEAGGNVLINAGVSASAAGGTQSTFTVYAIVDSAVEPGKGQNAPMPWVFFKDPGNTATLGNLAGNAADTTGQLPGYTTRRDAHGAVVTVDGHYTHIVDRIQNTVEVIKTGDDSFRHTYDLTSADGQGSGAGPCEKYSVSDDPGLPRNDPGPDLLDKTPDGKYLVIAFRGPAPVTVTHAAQASCPGVGIVRLTNDGASGRLVTVLRATNTLDTAPVSAPGGYNYSGDERSDVHGAVVIHRTEPRYRHYRRKHHYRKPYGK